VREACGIPGTTVRTAFLCRDKPSMKEVLREAGIPTAQSSPVGSRAEARAFAERAGFPLIVKPRSSAGAAGTVRVDDPGGLEAALAEHGVDAGASVALEEFIEGHEGFYDTLCVDGKVVHEFVSHYYPGVLEAMRTRWISPYFVTTNRLDAPAYAEVKAMSMRVIRALGIGTSATHMEWFFGSRGLKFSEIGCRPPGVGVWDLYCAANEFDLYKEWAMAIVHGHPATRPTRRFAAGMITLRPDRDGRIAGYEGVEAVHRAFGQWIIDSHLPPLGTPTQPVEAGYMANAWVRMRHPDYDELRRMLEAVGRTLKVRAA
jgi:phosphoribosylaminoimidazole carboxylase (NCAIR synthetase)